MFSINNNYYLYEIYKLNLILVTLYYICNLYFFSFKNHFFQSNGSLSKITATCNDDLTLTYDYPLWPTCVSYLECPTPSLDSSLMKYDWTNATGLAPGIKITFVFYFKKLINSK